MLKSSGEPEEGVAREPGKKNSRLKSSGEPEEGVAREPGKKTAGSNQQSGAWNKQ